MGSGFTTLCNSCKDMEEAILGVGFMYLELCRKTLKKMKSGKFGEEYKKIVNDNPNCNIDCEKVIFYCKDCKKWHVDTVLDLYKGNEEDTCYNINDDAVLLKKFEHKCKYCGSKNLEIFHDFNPKMKCNKCGGELIEAGVMMWD